MPNLIATITRRSNHLEPGKRPFHTIIPAMVFKDNNLMSFGVMGGGIQPQGHGQVLVNIIHLGMGLQQAIDAPRYRYTSGRASCSRIGN